ncbi:MAG: DUF362 domain-containing protein [Candidatus Lokiarchaeota archaeon]|nr:DUF362 domain-containing protein [Candidatus Lokiarchaeota archaeon]
MKPKIALVNYENSPDSLEKAIKLCDGFSKLEKRHNVLIKPNLLTWSEDVTYPPYGMVTTTRLIEDIIILLKKHGCKDISIGEGSVAMHGKSDTPVAFRGLGYKELADKYDVTLIDFNESKSIKKKVNHEISLLLAKPALEADFFINVPVLKTHSQTKVSIALKNVKGCLKPASKKFCHHPKLSLEHCFQFIVDYIKPNLNIVDGIYALNQGPLYFGKAIRKNVIIASRNVLGTDLVAAKSIGFDPNKITHFREYAQRKDVSLHLKEYTLLGNDLEKNITPLEWDWAWTEDNTGPSIFAKLGVEGIAIQKYDESLCSGCSPISNMVNILILSAFKKKPFPSIEILNGKRMQARPGYDTTLLLGNCIIRANKENLNIKNAYKVKGCPPKSEDVVSALRDLGISVNPEAYKKYIEKHTNKYLDNEDFSLAFYRTKL